MDLNKIIVRPIYSSEESFFKKNADSDDLLLEL